MALNFQTFEAEKASTSELLERAEWLEKHPLPLMKKEGRRLRAVVCGCLMCLAEGENSPHALREQRKLVPDWEDVEPWCEACQTNHWQGQCDPDDDRQRLPHTSAP